METRAIPRGTARRGLRYCGFRRSRKGADRRFPGGSNRGGSIFQETGLRRMNFLALSRLQEIIAAWRAENSAFVVATASRSCANATAEGGPRDDRTGKSREGRMGSLPAMADGRLHSPKFRLPLMNVPDGTRRLGLARKASRDGAISTDVESSSCEFFQNFRQPRMNSSMKHGDRGIAESKAQG